MSLKGKTLFITGASRGIGLAIAKRAAADGANVAIAAKTSEPHPKLPGTIHSAAQEVVAAGGALARAQALAADIARASSLSVQLAKQMIDAQASGHDGRALLVEMANG